jgi:hypothetical protein
MPPGHRGLERAAGAQLVVAPVGVHVPSPRSRRSGGPLRRAYAYSTLTAGRRLDNPPAAPTGPERRRSLRAGGDCVRARGRVTVLAGHERQQPRPWPADRQPSVAVGCSR